MSTTKSVISRIESGQHRSGTDTLRRLAEAPDGHAVIGFEFDSDPASTRPLVRAPALAGPSVRADLSLVPEDPRHLVPLRRHAGRRPPARRRRRRGGHPVQLGLHHQRPGRAGRRRPRRAVDVSAAAATSGKNGSWATSEDRTPSTESRSALRAMAPAVAKSGRIASSFEEPLHRCAGFGLGGRSRGPEGV